MASSEDAQLGDLCLLFEKFRHSSELPAVLEHFRKILSLFRLSNSHKTLYSFLKAHLYSSSRALWVLLDSKWESQEFSGRPCRGEEVVVVGAGPAGIFSAIQYAFLGANVTVIEKRQTFSRHNVVKLWPSGVYYLKSVGVKYFFPSFCSGGMEHIGIRRLQSSLLKVALVLGITFHFGTCFEKVSPPSDSQSRWLCGYSLVREKECQCSIPTDLLIAADGARSKVSSFFEFGKRVEGGRHRLIGITCNFENRGSLHGRLLKEFSLVSFLNRDKFTQIREATGVEFENLVFFRDENYYFVLTPKISSLVQKGVLHHGQGHPSMLLTSENVNREKLRELGREIADFCSLPSTSNYVQVKGEDDIQLFDFSTKTSCCQQVKLIPPPSDVLGANHLFVGVVGDALIEPFWPMGTGTNRALQSAMDIAWLGKVFSETLSQEILNDSAEDILKCLLNVTDNHLRKPFESHTIHPSSRYARFLKK